MTRLEAWVWVIGICTVLAFVPWRVKVAALAMVLLIGVLTLL